MAQAEFGQNVRSVRFDGGRAHAELLDDVGIGEPFRHCVDDTSFARAEPAQRMQFECSNDLVTIRRLCNNRNTVGAAPYSGLAKAANFFSVRHLVTSLNTAFNARAGASTWSWNDLLVMVVWA